jgi:RHS repeat-associated protein
MERDDEVKGGGNSYTTEFRQYDPRLGRWLTLDPLMLMFPHVSPYVAFDNNPIYYTDPYGLAPVNPTGDEKSQGDQTSKKEIEYDDKGFPINQDEKVQPVGTLLKEVNIRPVSGQHVQRDLKSIEHDINEAINKVFQSTPTTESSVVKWLRKLENATYGSGETIKGGEHYTSKDATYHTQTKTKSKNNVNTRDIGDLLDAWGAKKKGSTSQKRGDQMTEAFDIGTRVDERIEQEKKNNSNTQPALQNGSSEKIIIQAKGGSYMYHNGEWYRRQIVISDSTYYPINEDKVPENIKVQVQ